LIGKEAGEFVEVMTPGGGKSYEIVRVRFDRGQSRQPRA
jgi:transcription elongation GreA/GreB family factor